MIKRIVINTGPLITLQRIEAIETVGQLPFEFVAPEEVRAKLDTGVSVGHPQLVGLRYETQEKPMKYPLLVSHCRIKRNTSPRTPLRIIHTITHITVKV